MSPSPHGVSKPALIPFVTTPPHLCRYCLLWGLIPLTVLFSPKAHSSGEKRPLHIKGRSFLISTFSCASLGNIGFHGMQDPLFGSLQSTPLWAHVSLRVGPTLLARASLKARYNFSCDIITWRNKRKKIKKKDINRQLRKGGQPHNFPF